MKRTNVRLIISSITTLAAAASLLLPSFTMAQSGGGESAQGALEEVIVTARKREENLQEVGLSLSALSKSDLDRRFDIDLQTLQNASPNLVINDIQQGPGSPAAISIRGIGTTDVEKNFDPTVGVVVDGVFVGVNSGAMLKAIDLEAVEILRGPQGTLFGRNSIGGVINVTRGRPNFDGFSGSVKAGYGNHDDIQVDAFINITASEMFAFRLGGAYRKNDGWFYNATLGRHVGEMDYTIISPSFTFRPTENLEIYYRYDNTKQDQDANTLHNVATAGQVWCFYYNQCSPAVGKPQSGKDYVVLQNDDPPYQTYFDTELHVVNATWTVNDSYSLDYVFGDFSTDEKVYQDWDSTPLTLYHTDRPAKWNQQSHELRLNYSGDKLSYTAGLYYWDSDYSINLQSYIGFGDFLYGLPAGTVLTLTQDVKQTTKSKAVFLEADYAFTDQWILTLGGRYTKDKKTSSVVDPLMPELLVYGNPDNPFRKSWDEFTPKVGLRFQARDNLMVYGLYSKGFRAGGFNGRPLGGEYLAAATPYDPETVDNYELGFKSQLLNDSLRFNASIFQMDYKDKQEEQSVPTGAGTGQQTLVVNAAQATIKGLEIDLNWVASEIFSLEGALGLLDAKYDKLIDPPTGTDLSYVKLRRAPDVTATLAPVLTFEMPNGEITARAAWHYVDDVELTFLNSPQSHVKGHSTFDASITYTINGFSISLWGLNLGDDNSWSQAYDVGTGVNFAGLWTYAAIRPPRAYGAAVRYDF